MGLDGVALVMAYEEAFGVRFADQDVARMRTPRDVIELIASQGQKRGETWTREEIALLVRQVTLAQLGDRDYSEDSRFIEDLGVA